MTVIDSLPLHYIFVLVDQRGLRSRSRSRSSQRRMATVGGIKESEGSANSLEVDALAQFAVQDHNNKQNAMLEFSKVVNTKQQVVAGTIYYITLEATDGGIEKLYEAKVWVKPWLNFKEVQDFKLLGDQGSSSA